MNRLTTEAFKVSRKIPLVVVLDHVRSLNNVGSVFRTSDAFRVKAIYLCGITACPPHAEIHKTALGAEESVDWLYFKDTMDAEAAPGRKLGFIAQEMGREINTLGSKANEADIQKLVVRMKDELEKIKEQLANIL